MSSACLKRRRCFPLFLCFPPLIPSSTFIQLLSSRRFPGSLIPVRLACPPFILCMFHVNPLYPMSLASRFDVYARRLFFSHVSRAVAVVSSLCVLTCHGGCVAFPSAFARSLSLSLFPPHSPTPHLSFIFRKVCVCVGVGVKRDCIASVVIPRHAFTHVGVHLYFSSTRLGDALDCCIIS